MIVALLLFAAGPWRLRVPAAAFDRAGQRCEIPPPLPAEPPAALLGKDGSIVPAQVVEGRLVFVIPWQRAGEPLEYAAGAAPAAAAMSADRRGGEVELLDAGDLVAGFRMDRDALPRPDILPTHKRPGYLHPLRTAAGVTISDDYPRQHIHHHGLWEAWTHATFAGHGVEFWDTSIPTGEVAFAGLDATWSGRVEAGLRARLRWLDRSRAGAPAPVLDERLEIRCYPTLALPGGKVRLIDWFTEQVCAGPAPLELSQYRYGGLGFRGRPEWLDGKAVRLLTSEGDTDRARANGRKARWIYFGGVLPEGQAGIVLLCAPENFRAPQALRVNPTEPFICYSPSVDGPWAIRPGHPYLARYRAVLVDGAPSAARIEALWNGFAHPAQAAWSRTP